MMQDKLVGDVHVTPREVEQVFNEIPKDSLPRINAQVEFAMIVKAPKPTPEEISRVKRKLEDFRKGIMDGTKDFCVLAELYSEDPGSKENCGELEMVSPGTMVAAFDAVALSLKEGDVSQVFETEYGYHIMRVIARRGQQYKAQHILLRPQTSGSGQAQARAMLDSLATQVRLGKADFARLAAQLSDDDDSRAMNGTVVDPTTNNVRWSMGDLEQQDFFVIDKLKVGEISDPLPYTLPDGTRAWRIIRLIARTEPHVANLKDDQQLFQRFAESRKKQKAVNDWVKERVVETYVRINDEYKTCAFEHPWITTGP
jgi:peptidyl-prolyl cis-trans isomerase SurA